MKTEAQNNQSVSFSERDQQRLNELQGSGEQQGEIAQFQQRIEQTLGMGEKGGEATGDQGDEGGQDHQQPAATQPSGQQDTGELSEEAASATLQDGTKKDLRQMPAGQDIPLGNGKVVSVGDVLEQARKKNTTVDRILAAAAMRAMRSGQDKGGSQ